MSALVRPVHATRSNPRIEAPIPALPPASSTAVASNGFLDFWNGDMSTVVYQHDTGNREGYYGEMTVSPDERYIACSDGKLSVFELPDSLHGS